MKGKEGHTVKRYKRFGRDESLSELWGNDYESGNRILKQVSISDAEADKFSGF